MRDIKGAVQHVNSAFPGEMQLSLLTSWWTEGIPLSEFSAFQVSMASSTDKLHMSSDCWRKIGSPGICMNA
jgi:hypothetical protein